MYKLVSTLLFLREFVPHMQAKFHLRTAQRLTRAGHQLYDIGLHRLAGICADKAVYHSERCTELCNAFIKRNKNFGAFLA